MKDLLSETTMNKCKGWLQSEVQLYIKNQLLSVNYC